MSIDWFTFVAQIINFLVLVGLLRWLLYGRIVKAMEQREEKISARLDEAERKRQTADERMEEYEHKLEELDQQRDGLLRKAKQQADQRRQELLSEAQEAVEEQRTQWHDSVRREREDLFVEIRHEVAGLGLQAARQTLEQLAATELEQRMCDAFVQRIEQLDEEHRREISEQLSNGQPQVSVWSQFELPDTHKDRLRSAIHNSFDFTGEIVFERAADLICGLELEVGGYSFGWNAREFLEQMERRLEERLKIESGHDSHD